MGPEIHYTNTLYRHPSFPNGAPCKRYWVAPGIMVGGSILDAKDGEFLASHGITHVFSVETEHDDVGKVGAMKDAMRVPFPDTGGEIPEAVVRAAATFFQKVVTEGGKVYVHCQQGGSRSPAIAYAMLRSVGSSKEEVLSSIRHARRDNWGEHQFHQTYLASIERALCS